MKVTKTQTTQKAERLDNEANASYNLNSQLYVAVFNLWTHVYEVNSEIKALESAGDTQGANTKREQMNSYIETNCPNYQNIKNAIYTALEKGGSATPFDEYPHASFLPIPKNYRKKQRRHAKTETVATYRTTRMALLACYIRCVCSSSAWLVFISNVCQAEGDTPTASLSIFSGADADTSDLATGEVKKRGTDDSKTSIIPKTGDSTRTSVALAALGAAASGFVAYSTRRSAIEGGEFDDEE